MDSETKLAAADQNAKQKSKASVLLPAIPTCVEETECLFAGLIFTERIDRRMLQRLLNSGLIYDERNRGGGDRMVEQHHYCSEATHLKRLMRGIIGGVAKVEYKKPKSGFGRVQPVGHLSLGSIRGEVRNTICAGKYIDIVVQNCPFAILRQVCESNGIACRSLGWYCDHEKEACAELAALFVEGSENAHKKSKQLVISIGYGGSSSIWEDENKEFLRRGYILPGWAKPLEAEFKSISRLLQKCNPVLCGVVKKTTKAKVANHEKKLSELCRRFAPSHEKVKHAESRLRQAQSSNPDGRFLSCYNQEWERRVLEVVFNRFVEMNVIHKENPNCVLTHDGLQVEADAVGDCDALLRACEDAVARELGFSLVFKVQKDMDGTLVAALESYEASVADVEFPPDKLMRLDFNYVKRDLGLYALKKRYIEHFLAKVRDPVQYILAMTIMQKGEHGEDVPKVRTSVYNAAQLREAWLDVGSGNYDKKGDEIPFISVWLYDPNIRVHDFEDFRPYNGVYDPKSANSDVLNLFMGYSHLIKTPLPEDTVEYRDRMLRPFFALGKALFEGSDRFFTFFIQCIAFKIQYPSRKHPYAFILRGKQGVGKNVFLESIGHLVGAAHFISSSNPEDFFSAHAEGFVRKLFAVLNECEQKDTRHYEGRIKAAISDLHLVVNPKNVRPYAIQNLAMLIIATNKVNPIPIDIKSQDRRFLVAKALETYLDKSRYDEWFWKGLVKHLSSAAFVRVLYDYLNSLDVARIDWKAERRACLTKAYHDMVDYLTPPEARFFEEFCQSIRRCEDFTERPYGDAEASWGLRKTHPELVDEPSIGVKQWKSKDFSTDVPMWNKAVTYRRADLFKAYKKWGMPKGVFRNYDPSEARFYNEVLQVLDLPIIPKKISVKCFRFTPKDVHDHLVKSNLAEAEGGDVEEPEPPMDESNALFIKRLVDKVVFRASCGLDLGCSMDCCDSTEFWECLTCDLQLPDNLSPDSLSCALCRNSNKINVGVLPTPKSTLIAVDECGEFDEVPTETEDEGAGEYNSTIKMDFTNTPRFNDYWYGSIGEYNANEDGRGPKAMAMAAIDKIGHHMPIMTRNLSTYIVGGWIPFVKFYCSIKSRHERVFYEIVQGEQPCKLFIDIDFKRCAEDKFDDSEDEDRAHLDTYFQFEEKLPFYVKELVAKKYNVVLSSDPDMIILDATTPEKFSRHFIFSNVVFASVIEMGNFVRVLVQDIVSVHPEAEWVDRGIYQPGRNFRIYNSKKRMKDNTLRMISHKHYSEEQRVMAGMITMLRFRDVITDSDDPLLHFATRCRTIIGESDNANNGNNTTKCSFTHNPRKRKCSVMKSHEVDPKYKDIYKAALKIVTKLDKDFSSFHQELNAYGTTILVWGVKVVCPNKGAKHRSNRTFCKVNVATRKMHFQCMDPDCRTRENRNGRFGEKHIAAFQY